MRCANIKIVDDDIFEGNQTFNFILNSSAPEIVPERRKTTVVIVDNDG